jgi:hypothetical protein
LRGAPTSGLPPARDPSPPVSPVYHGDSRLYRATREAFQAADASISDAVFLQTFRDSGCYLVNLCAEPVDRLEAKSRRGACWAHLKRVFVAVLTPVAVGLLRHATEGHEYPDLRYFFFKTR